MSVRDDASPIDDKPRARRLLLLQPLPRQRPARKVVRAVDLRRCGKDDRTRAEPGGEMGSIVGKDDSRGNSRAHKRLNSRCCSQAPKDVQGANSVSSKTGSNSARTVLLEKAEDRIARGT